MEQLRYHINQFDREFNEFATRNRYLLDLPTMKDILNVLENQNQNQMQSIANPQFALQGIDQQTLLYAIQLIHSNPQLLQVGNAMVNSNLLISNPNPITANFRF